MSNRSAKTKDFLQPEPSTEPPITPYQPKKIKPLTCLRSLRYIANSEKNYKDLNVKRKYYRKLYLCKDPCSSKNDKVFLKTYKKMKYVQRLEIYDFSSEFNTFFTKMSKFREVMINQDLKHGWWRSDRDTRERADVARNGPKLRRLNLTTFKISFKDDGWVQCKDLTERLASVLKGIIYMNSLKEFSIGIDVEKSNYPKVIKMDGPFIPTEISVRLKRLKKIERLGVALHNFPNEIFKNFIGSLGCLSSLKSIDYAALDQADKEFLHQISNFQSLNSVTLRHFVEPNEIILLVSKVPSLRTIAIKSDWIFNLFDMPAVESMKGQTLNIQKLHISAPLNIDNDKDALFVANFIDAFPQLRSLVLNLGAKTHKNILAPIGNAINRLQMLEEINLSILVRVPSVQNPFLAGLGNLKQIRKINFVLTKTISQGWDKDIKETHQALRTFLLASEKLEDLRIKWDVFTQKCFEHLSLILNEMKELNVLNLEYKPAHQDHGAAHKDTLKSIEECFSKTTTKIKNVTIKGSCGHVRGKSCDEIMMTVNEVIKGNKEIENFVLDVKRHYWWTPISNYL